MRALLIAILMTGPTLAQDAWVPRGTADLVLLDKIKGVPTNVAVKAGDSTVYGSLTIRVKSCNVRPPDQAADATAYVTVTDTRGQVDVFHGWILADTPAVSQLEHPLYDLRLLGCH